jgi:hypothetical protein
MRKPIILNCLALAKKGIAWFAYIAIFLTACRQTPVSEQELHQLLDTWHTKASQADSSYFDFMGDNAVFLGTDATERWTLPEFRDWSRKYFVAGKAWTFTTVKRNFSSNSTQDVVWFDEQLSTPMGPCRGSGVLLKQQGKWKIMQYNLTFTIPNALSKQVMQYLENASPDSTTDALAASSERIVQAQLDAYNSRDMEAFIRVFHTDAEVYTFGDPKPKARGLEAVRNLYQTLFDQSPQLHSQLLNRIVIGNKVLDHELITGRAGVSTPVELVMLYELQDSTIRSAHAIRP